MTKTKKESKKKFLMILLIVLLLALAVGYAAFSDTLTITGTANINSTFDVKFLDADVTDQEGCTATAVVGNQVATGTETNVTDDKLTVTVSNLAYPGAGANIQAVIQNVGTVPVSITSLSPSSAPTGNGNAIKISGLDEITTSHPKIDPNGTCTVDFTIYWDETVETLNPELAGENNNSYEFTFTITYEQNTTPIPNVATHTDA